MFNPLEAELATLPDGHGNGLSSKTELDFGFAVTIIGTGSGLEVYRDLTLARQDSDPLPCRDRSLERPTLDAISRASRLAFGAIGPESIRSLKPMPGSSPRWRFLADR